jgi:hypothetical protein
MSSEDQRHATSDGARVTEVLSEVRASVRQRHAVLATGTERVRPLRVALEDALDKRVLVPPTPQSHRGWLGKPIVAAKRLVYQVFMRWYVAPLIEQQNAFNRSVAEVMRELAGWQRELQMRELAPRQPELQREPAQDPPGPR